MKSKDFCQFAAQSHHHKKMIYDCFGLPQHLHNQKHLKQTFDQEGRGSSPTLSPFFKAKIWPNRPLIESLKA